MPRAVDPDSRATGAANSLLRRHAGVGPLAPLPEDVIEPAVIETCRVERSRECTALSARWLHDYPESERRLQLDARLREGKRTSPAPRPQLARMAYLFGAKAGDVGNGVPSRQVAGATNRFRTYYHHAVPFGTEWIQFLWNHCKGNGCELAGRRAAERVGFAYQPIERASPRQR